MVAPWQEKGTLCKLSHCCPLCVPSSLCHVVFWVAVTWSAMAVLFQQTAHRHSPAAQEGQCGRRFAHGLSNGLGCWQQRNPILCNARSCSAAWQDLHLLQVKATHGQRKDLASLTTRSTLKPMGVGGGGGSQGIRPDVTASVLHWIWSLITGDVKKHYSVSAC